MKTIPAARPLIFWLKKIELEYHSATHKFSKFNSAHEGYAVIKEELDELWELVKKSKQSGPNQFQEQQNEAIQVAAMSLRFLVDLC
jgi:hypothetical protein